MKIQKRIIACAALALALSIPTATPAGETCGPDSNRRAAIQACKALKPLLGHVWFTVCVEAARTCSR